MTSIADLLAGPITVDPTSTALLIVLVYEMRIQNQEVARAVPELETRDDWLNRIRKQREAD